jgi:hypothetical protein
MINGSVVLSGDAATVPRADSSWFAIGYPFRCFFSFRLAADE